MKKIIAVACAIACALALSSCASTAKAADTKKAETKPAATATAAKTETAAVPEHGVIYSGSVDKKTFLLADNHQYGKNFQFQGTTGTVLPKDYKAMKGDVIKIHIEGTASKEIVAGKGDDGSDVALWFNVIDTSAAASYWTKLTAGEFKSLTAIPAGGPFSFDITFNITTDAKSKASGGGANIMAGTSNNQAAASALNVTKYTYEITRP